MSIEMNNFLQAMAEAKQAIDAMPEMKRELEHLRRQTHIHGETIANRELHIHNLKQSEMALTQKLRSVEAERDEAMFRTLEGEEKVQALLSHLQQSVQASLALIAATQGTAGLVVVTQAEQHELTTLREENAWQKEAQADLVNQRENAYRQLSEANDKVGYLRDTCDRYETEIASLKAYISHEPKDESGQSAGFSAAQEVSTTVPIHVSASDPIPAAGGEGEPERGTHAWFAWDQKRRDESADTPTPIVASGGIEEVQAQPEGPFAQSVDKSTGTDPTAPEGSPAATGEGSSEGPFASSSTDAEWKIAGEGAKPNVSSSEHSSGDDTWPIFSRASHNS